MIRSCALLVAGFVAALGCASGSPPITKLVGGRVIFSRSVNAAAYEHAVRALVLEEEGRWVDAAAELQRALIYDDDAPELHARLAELFIRLDRLGDAEKAIRDSLGIEVTVDALIADAHLKQQRGHPGSAVASLERAVGLVDFAGDSTKAESAYLELADAALLALDADRARKALEALCGQMATSLSGRLRLAGLLWAQGDVRQAERWLKEVLGEEPNQLDALVSLAWLQAALGHTPAARTLFREALERSEGALEIATGFARFLIGVGETKEADQLVEELALPTDPQDPEMVARWVELARAAKSWDRAIAYLRAAEKGEATAQEVKARIPLFLAVMLEARGERAGAIATFTAITKDAATFQQARLRASQLLRENGQAAEALRVLEGVETGADEVTAIEVTVGRALADERAGDPARGIRRLEEALARKPGDVRLTIALAGLEERRGQWRRALAAVDPILTKLPGSVEALNFWGFVAVDHNHAVPLATRRLLTALALDPAAGAIIDSVGWAHFRAGDLDRAALFLEQAGRLEPDDPEILTHLGELYARRKEPERAASAYRKALAQKPEETLRRRLEDQLARIESQKAARP